MIKLDKQWSILGETHQWELRQEVEKTRKKKDGTIETYLSNNSWYHHNLKWILNKYLNESLKSLPTIGTIILKLDEIEETINELKIK